MLVQPFHNGAFKGTAFYRLARQVVVIFKDAGAFVEEAPPILCGPGGFWRFRPQLVGMQGRNPLKRLVGERGLEPRTR